MTREILFDAKKNKREIQSERAAEDEDEQEANGSQTFLAGVAGDGDGDEGVKKKKSFIFDLWMSFFP